MLDSKVEIINTQSLARVSLARFSSLASRHSHIVGRFSTTHSQIKIEFALRSYCTSKEESKKKEEKTEAETSESESAASPFARRSAASTNKYAEKQENEDKEEVVRTEESKKEESKENPNSRLPPGKVFTPTYIISINTEKNVLPMLWRALGLLSFNFGVSLRAPKQMPDGSPIPAFWQRQVKTARLDMLLFTLGLCAITGSSPMIFAIWLVGIIFFPQELLPSVMRKPTRGEVRAFVYDHLKDLDEEDTGLAEITDAKRVLHVIEKDISPEVLDALLQAAGSDGEHVDYKKLSEAVVGDKIE